MAIVDRFCYIRNLVFRSFRIQWGLAFSPNLFFVGRIVVVRTFSMTIEKLKKHREIAAKRVIALFIIICPYITAVVRLSPCGLLYINPVYSHRGAKPYVEMYSSRTPCTVIPPVPNSICVGESLFIPI